MAERYSSISEPLSSIICTLIASSKELDLPSNHSSLIHPISISLSAQSLENDASINTPSISTLDSSFDRPTSSNSLLHDPFDQYTSHLPIPTLNSADPCIKYPFPSVLGWCSTK
ncbi:hypothetical protein HMI55_000649 [Coelomomyces lativittatus]|nr:hypothetical protein HMI55_000649 [Coelomomyces lativittatus]